MEKGKEQPLSTCIPSKPSIKDNVLSTSDPWSIHGSAYAKIKSIKIMVYFQLPTKLNIERWADNKK